MCYLFIESTFVVSFRFSSHKAKFYLLDLLTCCGSVVKALDARLIYEDFILTNT